jgi:peroxiredoxin
LREAHNEISGLGARIVAIGTGDHRYTEAFVREEQIPYLVLVDDDGAAAQAASVRTLNWFQLLHPRTWKATRATSKRGHHVHKAGKRVRQIGATFVIDVGDQVIYEHHDADSTDHAPMKDIIGALQSLRT